MTTDFQRRIQHKRQRNLRWDRLLLIVILLGGLFFGTYLLLQSDMVQKRFLYPFLYREAVEAYADRYGVEINFAAAVIQAESKFERDVRSHRGAVGLMQLMPDTAEWIAELLEDRKYTLERLEEPECNIRYGIWYLSYLQKEFGGNKVLALAAYNAGYGNVESWMEEYHWDMDFQDIDAIPYSETRHYVRRVLEFWEKYRELYGDSSAGVDRMIH